MYDTLLIREDLAILAKQYVEGLELGMCLVHELYLGIPFGARHEVVDIDLGLPTPDTIDTSNALHQAGRVPGGIIV